MHHTTLIILSVIEVAVFIAVLAFYLMKLGQSLGRSSANLTKVSAGVKAVEGHCAPIGPVVTTLNAQLTFISTEMGTLAGLAQTVTSPPPSGAGSTGRRGLTADRGGSFPE